jgi:predicted DCC family thiol-disulfide oxidoreductase YuxK
VSEDRPVVVFDALCLLCSANARFILRHDRRRRFRLASMQSEAGAALYRRFGIDPADPETLILVEGGRARRDSDAVLAIWSGLGWPWRAAAALRIVPAALRDPLYRWVARNRYRWFGRRETCWLPAPQLADRFL